MKAKLLLLLSMIPSLVFSQAIHIPMPTDYGTDYSWVTGTPIMNKSAVPLFQYGNHLYCKARHVSGMGISGQEGFLFKVNMLTNDVTLLTTNSLNPNYPEYQPLHWDYGMSQLRNVKFNNNEIYFNGWQTSIYKINPSANTLSHLTNVQYDFEVMGNVLLPIGGNGFNGGNGSPTLTNLDQLDQTHTSIYTGAINGIEGDYIRWFFSSLKINNTLYSFGAYQGVGTAYGNNVYRIYKTDEASYPSLNTTILNTTGTDLIDLIGFYNNDYKPYVLNNKIIWVKYNYQEIPLTKVVSFNLSTNTFNENIFSDDNGNYDSFLYNNLLYIKHSNGQFYVTDGNSPATSTNIPNFFDQPFTYTDTTMNYSSKIIEYNGYLFGLKYTATGTYEVWKSDATASGTQLIESDLYLTSAKVHNGSFYAIGYVNNLSNYYNQKILKFNDNTNTFDVVYSFPDNFGTFGSQLFFKDNFVFFTTDTESEVMPKGLYKLDLNTLSTEENVKNEFSIYPNPTEEILNFSRDLKDIKIYDTSGKLIQSTIESNDKIDISTLSNGNYILKGETDNGEKVSKKFIKN